MKPAQIGGSFLLALLLACVDARGDSDEPPLFVAGDGVDTGDCRSEVAPCRTLSYALRRVGKNGRIRVRGGSFGLREPGDVAYLLSRAIDVRAEERDGEKPTIVGVPNEFAEPLKAKGFRVIADSKSLRDAPLMAQLGLQSNQAATVCAGGLAAGFPCDDVDLVAHVADRASTARGADIWGFMDLNTHREYAIVGYSSGTAVYDVSDPEQPHEVGFINGQSTTWRDIKVHQFWNATDGRWNSYAYITADGASDGLFVIDLGELPQRIRKVAFGSDFAEAHNVYITATDFSTGLALDGAAPQLIIAGSNRSDGRFRSYSLATPGKPQFVAAPETPAGQAGNDRLYMHDAASMLVTDARKDTQCVNAGSSDHCDILFDFNESTVDIWDITAADDPVRLSQLPYAGATYTHSGWPSEDQQYLFVQDELDERDRGLPTTLRVVDISNLTAPVLSGTWQGPNNAIDHNGFVRGNRYYMSNYARGLTILDITQPDNPSLAGYFDTYPASNQVGFPGNWGAYPFFPSGHIGLSDIDSGFYLVADKTLDVPEGSLSFTASAYAASETQTASLVVQRAGGSSGAVSVRWQAIAATADFDDIVTRDGVLHWGDGDNSSRSIDLALNNDGHAEGLERVLIKLLAPSGGATLSAPGIASLWISDPGDSPTVEFAADSFTVAERGFGMAVAVVRRSGSALGPVSVDYAVTGGDAQSGSDYTGPVAGTLNWADGDANPKWIEYEIADDGNGENDEIIEITLSNPAGGSIAANAVLQIGIADGTGSNTAPNSVAGRSQTVAGGSAVTLDGSASNDPDGDTLTYTWTQTLGPNITLTNADAAIASFNAPTVSSDTLLRFELAVADPGGQTDRSTATVTVTARSGNDSGGGGSVAFWVLIGLFAVAAISRTGRSL